MGVKKLKILFVTPPAAKKGKSFEVFNQGGSAFPSLGILILASIARNKGHSAYFSDFLNSGGNIEDAKLLIKTICPDLVCISANTDMIMEASKLADIVKEEIIGTKVLIGGPHVTAAPVETMHFAGSFDIGFIGESEKSFSELLDKGISEDTLPRIKGIIFRKNNILIQNERDGYIENLDSLPFPAWDLIKDMKVYRPAVTNFKKSPVFSIMTSRGCSGRCIFCDRSVFGNTVRMHSPDYIIRMIRHLREQYGINEITFYDDNLVFYKKRLHEICNLILKEPKPLSWSCSARVDRVDEESLSLMKKSGCWQVSYGIESGSDKILKKICKGITVGQIKKTAEIMRKVGMSMRGYFIIGNPGETEETLDETLELIMSTYMDDILVEYMTPYPGTNLYNHVNDYGIMIGDWSSLNSYEINFIPHGMTKETLKKSFYDFYKRFYLRPRIIANYMMRLKNPLKMVDLGLKYLKFSSSKG